MQLKEILMRSQGEDIFIGIESINGTKINKILKKYYIIKEQNRVTLKSENQRKESVDVYNEMAIKKIEIGKIMTRIHAESITEKYIMYITENIITEKIGGKNVF